MSERLPQHILKMNPAKHTFAEGLVQIFVRGLEIKGSENLETIRRLQNQGTPILFFPNHLSHADAPVLDHALRVKGYSDIADNIYNMQGTVVTDNLITRALVTSYNCITIPSQRKKSKNPEKRRAVKYDGLSSAKVIIDQGKALGVFAEGSRSRSKTLKEVNPNTAIYLHMAPNGYVVPVGISGTENVLPPGKFFPRPAKARINFGNPIAVVDLKIRAQNTEESKKDEKFMAEIMGEIAKLLPEIYRGELY